MISMSELDGINKHLEELRKRIVRIVLVIGGITVFLLMFHAEPFQLNQFTLYYPTLEPTHNMAAQITNHMRINFSFATKEQLAEAVKRLSQCIKAQL